MPLPRIDYPLEVLNYIRERYVYVPQTGQLWIRCAKMSKLAFRRITTGGYAQYVIKYNHQKYKLSAHRLVWFLYYGYFPTASLDHINYQRTDNRIINLREMPLQDNVARRRGTINRRIYYIGEIPLD